MPRKSLETSTTRITYLPELNCIFWNQKSSKPFLGDRLSFVSPGTSWADATFQLLPAIVVGTVTFNINIFSKRHFLLIIVKPLLSLVHVSAGLHHHQHGCLLSCLGPARLLSCLPLSGMLMSDQLSRVCNARFDSVGGTGDQLLTNPPISAFILEHSVSQSGKQSSCTLLSREWLVCDLQPYSFC